MGGSLKFPFWFPMSSLTNVMTDIYYRGNAARIHGGENCNGANIQVRSQLSGPLDFGLVCFRFAPPLAECL